MGDAGALAAALGAVLLLAPLPRVPLALRRGAGALLLGAGWLVLLVGLVPGDDLRAGADRLAEPAAAALAAGGVIVAAALAAAAVAATLRWPAAWFVALAVALPIRLPVSLGSNEGNLLVPLYLVIAVGIAAVAVAHLRGRRPVAGSPAPMVDWALAAFVGYTLLTLLWSADGDEGAVKAVFFYIPFSLLYVVVLSLWPRTDGLRWLAGVTLAIALPIAILALSQYGAQEIFWNRTLEQANVYSRFFRVNGIFFDPNVLGRFLAIAVVAAVTIAHLTRRPRDLLLLGGLSAVLMAGMLVTFSRSSALMLMVGLTMLAWRAFGGRRTAATVGVLAVAFAAVALATSANVRATATSAERLETVSEGRFDLMRGGIDIWRDHPIAGAGLGSFAARFEEGLDERERRRTRVVISHNAPVTVLSEGGVIGLVLMIALGAALGVTIARRSARPAPAPPAIPGGPATPGWPEWALLAVVAGILVHALLYSALFEDPYAWVAAAAALALAAARLAPSEALEEGR